MKTLYRCGANGQWSASTDGGATWAPCANQATAQRFGHALVTCEAKMLTDHANEEFWRRLAGNLRKAIILAT